MSEATGVMNGCTPSGSVLAHALQPLLHELPRLVDVRAPAELGEDERERHVGIRAQPRRAGDAHERAFDRLRDERLDFLRREARRFGEDDDRRLRQVRQHLDRQLHRRLQPRDQQQQRDAR